MKAFTLNNMINEQLEEQEFAAEYNRELLINAIAKVVVKLRKNKKLTQSQLADKLGTSQSVIARLESGNDSRIPSLDMLARIANATQTKISISFDENDLPPKKWTPSSYN